jgi:hypothetical protein
MPISGKERQPLVRLFVKLNQKKEGAQMTTKSEFILSEALSMSPTERARIAHCLIYSLEKPKSESVDAQWIQLTHKRCEELVNGTVQPVSWAEIKNKIMS